MIYFAMNVEEKKELEKKGFVCKGSHRIFVDKIFTGKFKWEFDVPGDPISNAKADPEVKIKGGEPVPTLPEVEELAPKAKAEPENKSKGKPQKKSKNPRKRGEK
jgi:hypothetical protein